MTYLKIGEIDFPLNVINNWLLYTLNLTPHGEKKKNIFSAIYFIAVLKTSVSDSLIKFRISSWYCSQSVQESFTPWTFRSKLWGEKMFISVAPPGSSNSINIKYLPIFGSYISCTFIVFLLYLHTLSNMKCSRQCCIMSNSSKKQKLSSLVKATSFKVIIKRKCIKIVLVLDKTRVEMYS